LLYRAQKLFLPLTKVASLSKKFVFLVTYVPFVVKLLAVVEKFSTVVMKLLTTVVKFDGYL
jgi:hypothetical protein